MDYKSEMKTLRDILNEAGYRYYVLDDPTMDDYRYDQLLRLQQRTYQPAPDIRAFGNVGTQRIAYNLIQGRYRVVYLSNQLGICFFINIHKFSSFSIASL